MSSSNCLRKFLINRKPIFAAVNDQIWIHGDSTGSIFQTNPSRNGIGQSNSLIVNMLQRLRPWLTNPHQVPETVLSELRIRLQRTLW
jgi:hypothetical protein